MKLTIAQINGLPQGAYWLRANDEWRLAEKYDDGWWLLMGCDCQIEGPEVAEIASGYVRIKKPSDSRAERNASAFFKPVDNGGATPV